jgi:hypothetical protein
MSGQSGTRARDICARLSQKFEESCSFLRRRQDRRAALIEKLIREQDVAEKETREKEEAFFQLCDGHQVWSLKQAQNSPPSKEITMRARRFRRAQASRRLWLDRFRERVALAGEVLHGGQRFCSRMNIMRTMRVLIHNM